VKYARLSLTINRRAAELILNAEQFLEMTETAFRSGDLSDQKGLCEAIGGANHVLCKLPLKTWLQALEKAPDDWFGQWPDSLSSLEIHGDTFFLGRESQPTDLNTAYMVYRLFRFPRVIPDSSVPIDLSEDNLKIMVGKMMSELKPLFVTDWDKLNNINCCVAEAVEMLGLGEQILVDAERIAVSLEIKGALYRPTWIDAGFWLYWMPNLNADDDSGFARHLVTGGQGAKEWVCRTNEVQIKSAKVIRASRAVDYRRSELPDRYWDAARQWIVDGRATLESNKDRT
jgi:hypothetical protein